MEFMFGGLVLIIGSVIVLKNLEVMAPFSKGVGVEIAFSIVAAVALGQNYTQSLIPEANDGISISNNIAYWIIGEDRWTQEMFRNAFELSLYISLFLIMVYVIVLLIESKMAKKSV